MMMQEQKHTADFMVSEANGSRSREVVTLAAGNNLDAGAVLAKNTSTDKYTALKKTGTNGEATAAGVLYANTDATSADTKAVAIVRAAEVAKAALSYATGADISGLADVGIVAR